MKTLSQNTTSSACAPETGLQQLVATIVPDEQRISFWPQHFGLIPQWVTLEPRVFGWMDRLCENYCGGIDLINIFFFQAEDGIRVTNS